MGTLKAIETLYAGHRFRSRAEARWAVFFDHLGLEWEYEKEGFNLGDAGLYLPDFWLPSKGCWFEVKGQRPSEDELRKVRALAKQSGFEVFLSESGHFFAPSLDFDHHPKGTTIWAFRRDGTSGLALWAECWMCSDGNEMFLGLYPSDHWGRHQATALSAAHQVRYPVACYNSSCLEAAFDAARQARFEHGEKP